jgi:anion-transporting  ArsA/GET3 family ATPase
MLTPWPTSHDQHGTAGGTPGDLQRPGYARLVSQTRGAASAPTAASAATSRSRDFAEVRLHVVTGKGGTGKTTTAAALGLALAAGGRRVLLAEVEGRQGIAQLFDSTPLPYLERRIAAARDRGELYALAIDPEAALGEYLEMFYSLRRVGGVLRRTGAIDFATTIAPGVRDVLLTGKVKEAVSRRRGGRLVYDAVVLDAPPTGRIARFLNVTHDVVGLARHGPVHDQAQSVQRLLRSRQTAVHFVTLLEEMPLQETLDGAAEVTAVGLQVGGVFVNMTREPFLPPQQLAAVVDGGVDAGELARALKAAGIDATPPLVEALATEAADHARRIALEEEQRERLAELGCPTYELPLVTDPVDLGTLYRFADLLTEQGAA